MFVSDSFYFTNFLLLASLSHGVAYCNNNPNVLLIMCDDLIDYDDVYKNFPEVITPNLDKFRNKSVDFVNAHTNVPISAPSRASMFTGVYPHKSGNYWFTPWYENTVLSSSKTMMTYFRENGYKVYGTGKLMHDLVKDDYTEFGLVNYPGPLPFDGKRPAPHPSIPPAFAACGKLDGVFSSLADVPNVKANGKVPGYNGWYDNQSRKPFRYVNDNDRDLLRDEEHAIWVINKIKELENKKDDTPFFIGMGLSKPHTPLVAPQEYFDMCPLDKIKLPKMQKDNENLGYLKENVPYCIGYRHYKALKEAYPDDWEYGLRKYLQAYLACVTFADDIIGSVLDALEKSSFADNTVVIFVSDHGYDMGIKQRLFKNSLWNTSTEIPFYVYCPGDNYKHGVKVDAPVSLIDIYPTLIDLCHCKGSTIKDDNGSTLDGFSILPFLLDADATEEWKGMDVALTLVRNPKDNEFTSQNYCVTSKECKYILYSNGREELYDLANDPYEWYNLAEKVKYHNIKERMNLKLKNILHK